MKMTMTTTQAMTGTEIRLPVASPSCRRTAAAHG
jgi:hypothetical protein